MDHLIDDSDRLKPCPFYGGEAAFDHDDNGWNWIECLACGTSTNARVSAMDDCKPPLLEQWNKRVPSEVQPAPSVPDGWRLVPIVSTHEMKEAGACAGAVYYAIAKDVWTAMLAAAPETKP